MDWRLRLALSVASVLAFLTLWQVASTWLIDPFFLPSPVSVFAGAGELVLDGSLFDSIVASLARILGGWLLGSALAIPVGLLIGASRLLQSVVDPFVHFFRFVPAIALVTLFIVWFGVGETSKVLLIAYATGFIVVINTASGVGALPKDKLDAARCLGASPTQVFLHIVVPASLPAIYVGMRLALASSFLVIVAAEMLAADSGLGALIWSSRLYFRIDWMFVGIVTLGLLGFATDRLWKLFGRLAARRFLRDALNY
jgi:NitT/TauT family transport system permease protein